MSLADVVASNPTNPSRAGLPCSIGRLLDAMPERDRLVLLGLLYGPTRRRGGHGAPWADIYADLLKAKAKIENPDDGSTPTAEDLELAALHAVSKQQINRHRSGQCRCEGER